MEKYKKREREKHVDNRDNKGISRGNKFHSLCGRPGLNSMPAQPLPLLNFD